MGLKGADVYFSVWDGAGQVQSITASKYGTRADGQQRMSVALIHQDAFFFFLQQDLRLHSPYLCFGLCIICVKLVRKLHIEFGTTFPTMFHLGKSQMERFLMVWFVPSKKSLKGRGKPLVADRGLLSNTWAELLASASSAALINSLRLLECSFYTRGQLGMRAPSGGKLWACKRL